MKCLVFVGLLKLKTTRISDEKIEYNPSNIFPYKFLNYGTMTKYYLQYADLIFVWFLWSK